MTSGFDRLSDKTRRAAQENLEDHEVVIAVFRGRSKQAMIVTDRQILIVKAGLMAGTGLGAKVTSFAFEKIAAINVHTGPGVAALEVVVEGSQRTGKADLRAAYQQSNWLPCDRSVGKSPLIAELRTFVQSGGRSRSARAALSDS